MESISIVVPIRHDNVDILSLIARLDSAFFEATLSQRLRSIHYEIILVSNSPKSKITDIITTYLGQFPVDICIEKQAKNNVQLIIKGLSFAKYNYIVVIDPRVHYSVSSFILMFKKIHEDTDVLVAYSGQDTKLKRFINNAMTNVSTEFLFDGKNDVRLRPYAFKKRIWDVISFTPKYENSFQLEFLHRASEAGFSISHINIVPEQKTRKKKDFKFFTQAAGTAVNALISGIKNINPQQIPPVDGNSMIEAGLGYKKKRYVTHTTLHPKDSAIRSFIFRQKFMGLLILYYLIIGLIVNPVFTLQISIAVLTLIYFIDMVFNFLLVLKSLKKTKEITFTKRELAEIPDKDLPVYSILCPLYKESQMVGQFLSGITNLNYPKDKLDVLFLLEEDDKNSIKQIGEMKLPDFVRTVIVPNSLPKTKPKACNYGLAFAKGEYVVVYDAEDIPDTLQLKKAFLGFKKLGRNVICLQAKLNYYNVYQNLLTRLFTAEYSLWFDITLTGLQSLQSGIPLGGTSNHFRVSDLKKLRAWDPFNVTEDADLGMRLFKQGYQTEIIDSVTLEEANSDLFNWLRQRSRWIKGYMQTYLVHTREFSIFFKSRGIHALIFHLIIGGRIAFIFINPLLWLVTISYFVIHQYSASFIEMLYPPYILYPAITTLILGNFLYLFSYMIGCAKKQQWGLIKYVYLTPFYWIMISIAGFIALYQLFFKPHYWEKTIHGFHLGKKFPFWYKWIIRDNLLDLFGLLKRTKEQAYVSHKPRILILNWRDIKHKFAGGAEVYIFELAKRWVEEGFKVSIFCGNDGKLLKDEFIEGVQIQRRGGFYSVYIWAFLYYILKFRNNYDIIIDCENGIPFFSPLYARKKVFLLIHHVHQDVFRKSLKPPFSWIASYLELKIMPLVYRKVKVITVSPSSRREILQNKLTDSNPTVIYNGVDLNKFYPADKNNKPLVLYLGRLQYYKSLHIFLYAAKKILQKIPDVEFIIAGGGEDKLRLSKLANKLEINDKITFLGKVNEEDKVVLYQKAWVFVNPSMMEGWGITTIEANACGTPAVASDVPGLRDSINNPHTGYLVTYGSSDEFAQRIIEIIQNEKLREQLSAKSIKWAKKFSWETSARKCMRLFYKEVNPRPVLSGEFVFQEAL